MSQFIKTGLQVGMSFYAGTEGSKIPPSSVAEWRGDFQRRRRAISGMLLKHRLSHDVALLRRVAEGNECFVRIFVDETPLQKTHGENKESHMVTGLGGTLQIHQVIPGFQSRKIDARELILCLCMTGKGGVAEMLGTVGCASLAERGSPGFKFCFRGVLHYF